MTDHEYSFHPFDEREFRERFLPAIHGEAGAGNEDIVRELLDAADASGPSWTSLHKMFDETRVTWVQAVEATDGDGVQRTIFPAFARLLSHLRPAYTVRGFGLSSIDRSEFPQLTAFVKSPGTLLVDASGRPLSGLSQSLPARVPGTCLPGRSGGGVILKDDLRPFLKALRADLPRLAKWLQEQGLPAEPGLTMLLAAVVQAKLQGRALFEASDSLLADPHLPKTHKLTFEKEQDLAPAVVREVAKVFGREVAPSQPELEPVKPAGKQEAVSYSPKGTYKVGQHLTHKAFGTGEVTRILDSRRLKVRFEDEEKTLAQGLAAAGADDED